MVRVPKPTAEELKTIPLFASVSRDDRALLAAGMGTVELASGGVVIAEGQPNRAFYVVRDGELNVNIRNERRQSLHAGAFFGEISLGRGTTATATVVARTPSTLYVLDEESFRTLMQNTDAVLRIRGAMTDREAADRLFPQRR